jgi:hypothetical protein
MRQFASKGIISVEKEAAVCRNCCWSLLFCLGLGRIGREFQLHRAPVAQLDRAPDYGSGGWGFKSLRARQIMRVAINKFSHADVPDRCRKCRSGHRLNPLLFIVLLSLAVPGCETTTTTMPGPSSGSAVRSEAPRGFFDKLTDAITERECSVAHFTCPYGFGPAGEPCDCTDPRGVVLQGRTVK